MVRNTLTDLNNVLFEQLERLNDTDLSMEELEKEITRASAIKSVTTDILRTQKLALDVVDTLSEISTESVEAPKMLLTKGN